MSVDVVERLRLNEDDWLFGQTARDARRVITTLREQVEFWQKEAAGRRDDMANYTRIVSETIDRLNVEVSKLTKERDEYKSGFEAAASKYRNLKLQMQEIINVC